LLNWKFLFGTYLLIGTQPPLIYLAATRKESRSLIRPSEQIETFLRPQGAKNITKKTRGVYNFETGVPKGILNFNGSREIFAVLKSQRIDNSWGINMWVYSFGGKGFQQNVILTWVVQTITYAQNKIVDRNFGTQ